MAICDEEVWLFGDLPYSDPQHVIKCSVSVCDEHTQVDDDLEGGIECDLSPPAA